MLAFPPHTSLCFQDLPQTPNTLIPLLLPPPPQSPTAHPQIHATLRRGKATAIVPGVHGAEEVLGPQWVGATKITTTPENTALRGKVFAKENHVD